MNESLAQALDGDEAMALAGAFAEATGPVDASEVERVLVDASEEGMALADAFVEAKVLVDAFEAGMVLVDAFVEATVLGVDGNEKVMAPVDSTFEAVKGLADWTFVAVTDLADENA